MSHGHHQPATILELFQMNNHNRQQAIQNLNHQTVRQYINVLTNVQMGFRPNIARLQQDNQYNTWTDLYTDYVTEDNTANQDRQLLNLAVQYVELVAQKPRTEKQSKQHKRGRGRGRGGDKDKRGGGHHHSSHQQHVTTNGN